MTEVWHSIDIFNPKYEVSNLGRVRIPAHCDSKHRCYPERILRQQKNQGGYHTVCLSKSRFQKRFLVHRLVALYFVENPDGFDYVNHKDEDKDNNAAYNLEWCSWNYNLTYGTRIARCAKSHSRAVCQYSLDGVLLKVWDSARCIERALGYANTNISACCLRKPHHNTQYGYVWRFVGDSI